MFSDLASIREDLDTRLSSVLPEDWKRVPTLDAAIKSLRPVLYTEYTEFASSINGKPLGPGQVAAHIDLIIVTAETDTGKGENAADAHVLTLAQALQAWPDIYWDTAKKERLTGGQLAWRVSIICLTTIPPTVSGTA